MKPSIEEILALPVCGCGTCRQAIDTALKIVCDEIKRTDGDCILWHHTVHAMVNELRLMALNVDPTIRATVEQASALEMRQSKTAILTIAAIEQEVHEKLKAAFEVRLGAKVQ